MLRLRLLLLVCRGKGLVGQEHANNVWAHNITAPGAVDSADPSTTSSPLLKPALSMSLPASPFATRSGPNMGTKLAVILYATMDRPSERRSVMAGSEGTSLILEDPVGRMRVVVRVGGSKASKWRDDGDSRLG
jgi:hypothetical protein